jgi:hypothetical protein
VTACTSATIRPVQVDARRLPGAAWFPYLFVALVFVGLRVWSYWDVFGRSGTVYPDTQVYEQMTSMSVLNGDFWAGQALKTPGLPLFWKILPGSTGVSAPYAQWLVSVAAWLVLATVVATTLRGRRFPVVGFAVVLAFALTPMVAQWDGVLLTESLSISTTVLMLAALILVLTRPSWWTVAFALATAVCGALARDQTSVFELLLLVPVAVVMAWRGGRRSLGLVLAGGAVLVFLGGSLAVSHRGNEIGMAENVAIRVLLDPPTLRYFRAHGMPVIPNMYSELISNRFPPSHFYEVPELASFRRWASSRGNDVYLRWLATHPDASLGEPLRNLDRIVAPATTPVDGLDSFKPAGYSNTLPNAVRSFLYPQTGWLVVAWMCIAGGLTLIAALQGHARRAWLVPALVLVSTIPMGIFVWNADAAGRERHVLPVGLFGRLAMWMLALYVVDAFLAARAAERRQADAEPAGSGVSIGSSALQGKTIQRSVRLHTYSDRMTERGFS